MIEYTVITATYNSEKTVSDTIESVLNQSYKNIEYIIIDGKSNDNTLEIIKSYAHKFKTANIPFQFLSEKDSGIYDAWNKGLKLASGKWVSFLGSDDVYLKDAILAYHEEITQCQDSIDFAYSKVKLTKNGKITRKIDKEWSWNIFRRKMNIPHVGSFHNKDYFMSYGDFDTRYKIAGDYELLLRAGNKLKTRKVEETTVLMQEGGLSDNLVVKVLKETMRAKNETGKLNIISCYFDFFKEYLIITLKKIKSRF